MRRQTFDLLPRTDSVHRRLPVNLILDMILYFTLVGLSNTELVDSFLVIPIIVNIVMVCVDAVETRRTRSAKRKTILPQ